MPFIPELFSAPALARIEERREEKIAAVRFFDGLMTGEVGALIGSFVAEPEVHQPVRGRIKGAAAFERFVADTTGWMAERDVSVEDVDTVLTPSRGVEELVLHVGGDVERIKLPMALAADLDPQARISELRIYFSRGPLSGVRGGRPPLLQPDPELHAPDIVGDYYRALATGDVDAVLAAFEPDGYVSEPAGGARIHRGADGLRGFYERMLSEAGGISLELCAMTDDGRACALEYNAAARAGIGSPPEPGLAVHVRGDSRRLACIRHYGDADPALGRHLGDRPPSGRRRLSVGRLRRNRQRRSP